MTIPSPLPCDQVQALLVELVCGELPSDLKAAVRAHTQTCAVCEAEADQLERVLGLASALPMAEPSAAVSERVMLAARDALAARTEKAHSPLRPAHVAEADDKRQTTWWGRLTAWAFSPQIAMASVLLLMVGMGLYALPLGRQNTHLALEAAPEDRAIPAPAASATLAPPQQENEDVAPYADLSESEARKATSSSGGGGEQKQRSRPAREAAGTRRARESEPALAASDKKSPAARNVAMDESVAVERSTQAAAPKRAAAPQQDMGPVAFPASPTTAKTETARAANAGAPTATGIALEQGIDAVKRAAYAQAIALLEPVTVKGSLAQRNAAHLWLGRSFRGQGHYARAAEHYELALRAANVPREAFGEAADCFEHLGNKGRAQQLRQQMSEAN